MRGLFGDMFDLNRDGEMNALESALEYDFLESVEREGTGNYDDEETYEDDLVTELELAGFDPEELEFMDEDERREVLEDAGLNPDDYDF